MSRIRPISDKRFGMAKWKALQRLDLAERSGGQCEFEVLYLDVTPGETHIHPAFGPRERIVSRAGKNAWARCSETRDLVPAHVFRRWKNGLHETADGPPLMFHVDAVIAGCPTCHANFDSRLHPDEVRIPAARVAAARRIIEETLAAARARGEAVATVDLTHL
jgi:hypothetical protein